MKLLPPTLHGPLYPQSTHVYSEPTVEGALLTIFTDEASVYKGPRSVDGWVKLEKPLQIGQLVRATQSVGDDISPATPTAVAVSKRPEHLPAPEFVSVITNYSSVLAMSQLVIGATLEIWHGNNATLIAKVLVERPFQYVRLDLAVSIQNATYLVAQQHVDGVASERRTSPALNDISEIVKTKLAPVPGVATPLTACRTDLTLLGFPGLEVSVHNEGFVTSFLVAGRPLFPVSDCQSLQVGKLSVVQEIERVFLKAESQDVEVGPAVAPGKPRILAPYCPKIQNLVVADLDPGATISVFAWKAPENTWALLGVARVGTGQQDIPLPAELLEAEAIPLNQTLLICARQDRCDVEGELSEPIGISPFGLKQTPALLEPVVDCSQFIIVDKATAGTAIMLFDQNNNSLLTKPYHPVAGFNLISLARPVEAGEVIYGQCHFCDETLELAKVLVAGIPNDITMELGPVKPTDSLLHFTGCVIGSRIEIYRHRHGASQSVFLGHSYPLAKDWEVNIAEMASLGDEFQFLVYICNNAVSKGGQAVKQGRLSVSADPPTIEAGKAVSVTVRVKDSYYGNEIGADLYPAAGDSDGPLYHMGNSPMVWVVPADRTEPYKGIVKAANYEDANYLINVVKQQPVPTVNPTVYAEFLLKGGNIYTSSFQLTVTGKSFPTATPAELKIEYAQLVSDGFNVGKVAATKSFGSFSANQNGDFTFSVNFDLALIDQQTGVVINQGVTAVVVAGPTIFDAEFRRVMPQNDKGMMEHIR